MKSLKTKGGYGERKVSEKSKLSRRRGSHIFWTTTGSANFSEHGTECITSTNSQQVDAKSDPGTKFPGESLRCTSEHGRASMANPVWPTWTRLSQVCTGLVVSSSTAARRKQGGCLCHGTGSTAVSNGQLGSRLNRIASLLGLIRGVHVVDMRSI